MRLVSQPGKIVGGKILFRGDDILERDSEDLYDLRGGKISMIVQDPMTSLNPVMTIGFQITEAVKAQLHLDERSARRRSVEMLERVRIPDAGRRLKNFPHEFSGGMRQRVMIAMALCTNPQLLIADEPTTALDVTIQAQVLELMQGLAHDFQTATLLITHDLGVAAGNCQRVIVMYAGMWSKRPWGQPYLRSRRTRTRRHCSKRCRAQVSSAARDSRQSLASRRISSHCRRAAHLRRAARRCSHAVGSSGRDWSI